MPTNPPSVPSIDVEACATCGHDLLAHSYPTRGGGPTLEGDWQGIRLGACHAKPKSGWCGCGGFDVAVKSRNGVASSPFQSALAALTGAESRASENTQKLSLSISHREANDAGAVHRGSDGREAGARVDSLYDRADEQAEGSASLAPRAGLSVDGSEVGPRSARGSGVARRAEPASVAIDVEACVRLLGIAADRHERHARRLERSGYIGEGPDGERSNAVQLRALASALPGMGKDSEALAALRKALPNIAKDSERWRYVRDVSWHDVKRSELPGDLMDAVYRLDECTSSIKYPTAEHLDAAVDNLNAARAAQPEETP